MLVNNRNKWKINRAISYIPVKYKKLYNLENKYKLVRIIIINKEYLMFDDELHPEALSIIEDVRLAENIRRKDSMYKMSHIEARNAYLAMRSIIAPAPEVLKIKDIKIPVENQEINARYYRGINKDEKELLPLTIFFHGGGWVIGDLDTHDVVCRQLANEGKFDVLSIDYRMGPEHRFPTAINDAINSINWIVKNSLNFPINKEKIAVCGDSAGGNIAAVCSINSKINNGPKISFQALIYPSTHLGSHYKSKEKYDGYILSKLLMNWFEEKYINKNELDDYAATPILYKDLGDLPNTLIAVADVTMSKMRV